MDPIEKLLKFDGIDIRRELMNADIVSENRITDSGIGRWFYLKLGSKVFPLGSDGDYAFALQQAIIAHARQFEKDDVTPSAAGT